MHVRAIARLLLGLVVLMALSAPSALASTHTWNGPNNGLWSNGANWTGGVPTTGETGGTIVKFTGTSTASSTMDMSGLVVDEIHFTGTNQTIAGSTPLGINGATLVTNIADDAGGNTISVPLALSGAAGLANVASGQLTISGTISGSVGFVVEGTGASGVTLAGNNTYTGPTSVTSGTLELNSPGINTAVPGSSLTVGNGVSAAATVKLLQSLEIGTTTPVTVDSNGTLDLNSFVQSVDDLSVSGGTVSLGAGTVSTNGPLAMTAGTISGTAGAQVNLGGDVTATSSSTAPAAITAPVQLDGARKFTVTAGSQTPDLTIGSSLSDGSAASSLTKAGNGTMALISATGDTYTGGTTVLAGTVTTNHSTGVGFPGSLTIGAGTGSASSAVVRMLQSSELAASSDVVVNSDGLLDLNASVQSFKSLTLVNGSVTEGANGSLSTTGPVTMTGGSITGTGNDVLLPRAGLSATSSALGPATVASGLALTSNETFTVASGTPPELVVSGAISQLGGTFGLTKAGAGTLQVTGSDTYGGLTRVSAGTLIDRGQQTGAVTVDAGGTLSGNGMVGPLSVNGLLTPERGLRTGSLTFGAGGKLDVKLPSADPAAAPTISSSGPITIDPAATLSVEIPSGLTLPGGTAFPVIENSSGMAIGGTFGGGPFSTPDGVPLVAGYTALDGNDFALTAANVAPVVGAVSASPKSVSQGQPVAFSVSPSDANRDALTTSWKFGDGTTGTGNAVTHSYATAGIYHVAVTVSDGTTTTSAAIDVTVTGVTGGGTPRPLSVTSSAYGASFVLTGPALCVMPGKPVTLTLTITRIKGKHYLIAKVTKVVFTLPGARAKTARSAPFRQNVLVPAAAKPRTKLKAKASAYLTLRTRKQRKTSLVLSVPVCG
jgi:autotransporter-associated beta strand protein